jgi:hypothetical protein
MDNFEGKQIFLNKIETNAVNKKILYRNGHCYGVWFKPR